MELDGLFQSPPPTDQQPQQETTNPFLNGVDEADRAIVGKYIDEWDKNVQQRFGQIHEQYEPFKGVDPDDMNAAMQLMELLNNNPEEYLETIKELIAMNDDEGDLEQFEQPTQRQKSGNEYENIPPDFLDEFRQMQEFMANFGQDYVESKQAAQEAEEMRELDDLLGAMHNEYGKFDEDFILVQLSRGASPEEAINSWNDFLSNVSSYQQSRPSAPPIMGGQGGVPSSQVDFGKMNRSETQKFIASMLEASARER